jgi:hypothetical protein
MHEWEIWLVVWLSAVNAAVPSKGRVFRTGVRIVKYRYQSSVDVGCTSWNSSCQSCFTADTMDTWLGTRRHISTLLDKAAVAVTPQQLDACFDEEEEGEDSIPLVTPKAMTLFRQLLKYKVTPIGMYFVQVSLHEIHPLWQHVVFVLYLYSQCLCGCVGTLCRICHTYLHEACNP